MPTRPILKLVLIAGCLATVGTRAAELDNPSAIDEFLASQIEARGIPGVVALIVDDDEVLFRSAHGHRDVAQGTPMTDDTIFRIASMTKPIAATAVMMLVERGEISLDDPIGDYLPEYRNAVVIENFDAADSSFGTRPLRRPITIRHLLSHSSGIAYGFANDIVAALTAAGISGTDMPLVFDPGDGWAYGSGISIAARVLEQIEGIGLDEFLQRELFEPLQMTDTSFIVPADRRERVTTTHRRDESQSLVESANPDDIRSAVSGDGGLHSTAADYARFIQLILNEGVTPSGERLLSRGSVAELTRNQLGDVRVSLQDEPNPGLARAFPLGAGRDGFGLGFQITGEHEADDARAPGSLSWAGIFNTEFWIDPNNGIGGILLMQYLPFYDADAIAVLQGFEAVVYDSLR